MSDKYTILITATTILEQTTSFIITTTLFIINSYLLQNQLAALWLWYGYILPLSILISFIISIIITIILIPLLGYRIAINYLILTQPSIIILALYYYSCNIHL